MKISKNALEIAGVTENDYIYWCEISNNRVDRKKSIREFFKGIQDGKIFINSSTGKIDYKYRREKNEKR